MNNFTIRLIREEEISMLQKIAKYTFFEAFYHENTPENMNQYLNNKLSIEQLQFEFGNNESFFYFAEYNQEIIGYLKLNIGKAQTENTKGALEIERIYVLPNHQGKQFGKLLLQKAIEIARQEEVAFVWLGVWGKNPRAISFYQKNEFVQFGSHTFTFGDEDQTDIVMKFIL